MIGTTKMRNFEIKVSVIKLLSLQYFCCSTRGYVKQEAPKKQEEGLTNEGRHHLLLLYKQVHDKKGIAELIQAYITRVRLTG